MSERRKATSSRGRSVSTKKYERVKLKTTEASSSVSSTASAATRPRGLARAITTGWLPPPLRHARPTT